MIHWLYWAQALLIVIALLMIGVAIQEYLLWKKEGK
jgi:hypothetical protein